MSGQLYRDPDEDIREAEERDAEIEHQQEPMQERGHGERSGEPEWSDDEDSEDNDGGPPSGRSR